MVTALLWVICFEVRVDLAKMYFRMREKIFAVRSDRGSLGTRDPQVIDKCMLCQGKK